MLNKIMFLRWIARILIIVAILMMVMLSMDAFDGEGTFGEKLTGLFMHNIPVLILIAVLIIAWKKELAGGILLIVLSAGMMIWFHSFTGNPGSLIVILPFVIAGILFILADYLTKKKGRNIVF